MEGRWNYKITEDGFVVELETGTVVGYYCECGDIVWYNNASYALNTPIC